MAGYTITTILPLFYLFNLFAQNLKRDSWGIRGVIVG